MQIIVNSLMRSLLPTTLFLLMTILTFCGQPGGETSDTVFPSTGQVERIKPELDKLISRKAKIEVLTDEKFTWSEGPVWVDELDALLFSDVPENIIYKWDEAKGLSVYLTPSGTNGQDVSPNEAGSNGLTLDNQGRLVLAQHGNRQVSRMKAPLTDPRPEYTALADKYRGKKLNSPNDVIFDKAGNMYFTDPPYGLKDQDQSGDKELNFNGVYKMDTGGDLSVITTQLSRPNGLAFSPDENILYVANSDPEKAIWMAYELSEQGGVKGRLFFDATHMVKEKKGLPDGLRVDKNGNLFATGPGGVLVLSPEGEHLGTIETGVATANCEFGEGGKTLYMTAHQYLMRINLK